MSVYHQQQGRFGEAINKTSTYKLSTVSHVYNPTPPDASAVGSVSIPPGHVIHSLLTAVGPARARDRIRVFKTTFIIFVLGLGSAAILQ